MERPLSIWVLARTMKCCDLMKLGLNVLMAIEWLCIDDNPSKCNTKRYRMRKDLSEPIMCSGQRILRFMVLFCNRKMLFDHWLLENLQKCLSYACHMLAANMPKEINIDIGTKVTYDIYAQYTSSKTDITYIIFFTVIHLKTI